jgi:5-methylcytosine-specific restriction enzyme subunit McrC
VKTYSAIERLPTSIPVSDVLAADGSLNIFAEVREKGYFELDFRKSQLVIVGGKYIGHIPLNPSVLIEIKPKIGIARLTQILERAHEPLKCLNFYRRTYKTDEVAGDTIFEVLVKAFAFSVRKIAAEGLLREYLPEQKDLTNIRGRINALDTARRLHTRGLLTQANCRYFRLSPENALNKLIKYAIWYSAKHLVSRESKNKDLRSELADLFTYFDSVPLDLSMSFMDDARSYLASKRIPAIRSYYMEACDAAFAIVSDSGLDLLGEGRDIHLASFLIDMETVFEQYVRNVLKDAAVLRGAGLKVLDGNKEGRGWFFSDTRNHEAKPDLVVKRERAVELIGDMKYKPKIHEQDRYQVVAHAMSFDAKKALIVMPSEDGTESRLERLGTVGTRQGLELFIYRINIGGEDLSAEEEKLCAAINDLCSEPLQYSN